MDVVAIGRPGGDSLYIMDAPVLTEVFCPLVGWETARDGFCVSCGATDHETEQDMRDNAPPAGSTYVDGWA